MYNFMRMLIIHQAFENLFHIPAEHEKDKTFIFRSDFLERTYEHHPRNSFFNFSSKFIVGDLF